MTKGRVVAIYHRETRKVLGHIPCEVITKQTKGIYQEYAIAYRNIIPSLSSYSNVTQINYGVVHSDKGMPIKVIADSQRGADMLIASQGPSPAQRIKAILSEPFPLFGGIEVRG